jgi:hypothetical protein
MARLAKEDALREHAVHTGLGHPPEGAASTAVAPGRQEEAVSVARMRSFDVLRPYEALAEVRRLSGATEAVTGELDVPAVLRGRDAIIQDFDDSGPLERLRHAVPPFPTRSEIWLSLLEQASV